MTHTGAQLRVRIIGVALFLLAIAGTFTYFLSLAGFDPRGHPGYHLRAGVPSTIALSEGADVRIAGVKIGRVDGTSLVGNSAVISMTLNKADAPVYDNAQVYIGLKSQAGEAYVDLRPGGPPGTPLRDGGSLPIARAPESTQLDQVLDTFTRARRRDVSVTLDALGSGLAHEGTDLNTTLGTAHTAAVHAGELMSTLNAERGHVASLIDDFGGVAAALGERTDDVRLLTRRALVTAQTVASRDKQLRATLRALPAVLQQTQTTTRHLADFSRLSTPVIRNLRIASDSLVPAVAELGPAARAGKTIVTALKPFADRATPLVDSLRKFADVGVPLAGPLEATLRPLNPLVAYLAPYHRELGGLLGGLRATTDPHDNIGHYIRASVVYGRNTVAPALSASENAAVDSVTQNGAVQPIAGNYGLNPYPRPGTADHPEAGDGTVPSLTPDPQYPNPKGK